MGVVGTDALFMFFTTNNTEYYGIDFSKKASKLLIRTRENAFHWVNYIVYPNSQSVMLVTYNYRMMHLISFTQ